MMVVLQINERLKVFLLSYINIYMNYLISSFNGYIVNDTFTEIQAGVKYKLFNAECNVLIVSESCALPFVFNINKESENVLKVKHEYNNYYILFSQTYCNLFTYNFKYKNRNVAISISSKLNIVLDDVLICEKDVEKLSFSHYEIIGDLCVVYFVGKRNYVVVIKEDKVELASYYDECNMKDDEKYFMQRLNDSLNHGIVYHIKNKEFSQYLVYLDDEELKLKDEFVGMVFLDCILAGNLKYCNELLADNIKLKDENGIKLFFPEFDFYFIIESNKFILTKKNTLAGVYNFDIQNGKIINVSEC